jgi:hypothetical protein
VAGASVAAGSVASGGSVTTGGGSVAGGPPPQAAKIMLAKTTSETKKVRLRFTVLLLREWFEYQHLGFRKNLYRGPPSERLEDEHSI